MASVAARTQSRRTTRTSPHRAAATMMPIGLTALQRRPRVPDEMDPASRVGPQHALISALYTRTKPAYMYMSPPRAGGDGAERRARRPRRAPAGPAARAGYTGHQPPLQRARQRAGARGGRLLSPGTVAANRQAQCAGRKQRLPDGEDPAGGRQQPAAIHVARAARERRFYISPFGRSKWPLRREHASANRENPAVSIKATRDSSAWRNKIKANIRSKPSWDQTFYCFLDLLSH
jgi:hypothetical protein